MTVYPRENSAVSLVVFIVCLYPRLKNNDILYDLDSLGDKKIQLLVHIPLGASYDGPALQKMFPNLDFIVGDIRHHTARGRNLHAILSCLSQFLEFSSNSERKTAVVLAANCRVSHAQMETGIYERDSISYRPCPIRRVFRTVLSVYGLLFFLFNFLIGTGLQKGQHEGIVLTRKSVLRLASHSTIGFLFALTRRVRSRLFWNVFFPFGFEEVLLPTLAKRKLESKRLPVCSVAWNRMSDIDDSLPFHKLIRGKNYED